MVIDVQRLTFIFSQFHLSDTLNSWSASIRGKSGEIDAPIPVYNGQIDDLRRLLLRTLNDNQILILSNVEVGGGLISSILKEISEKHDLPISTLKLNAKILKELNMISYGTASEPKNVELSELGRFVLDLIKENYAREPEKGDDTRAEIGPPDLKREIDGMHRRVEDMIAEAGSGHLGSSLSALDIMATLYLSKMRHDPRNPSWEQRDRFLLGKGHAAPALYAVLAHCGHFTTAELNSLRSLGGLPGHPEVRVPGVEAVSGSLGQCLSIANGMALSARMSGDDYRVYVLLGDGELDEGQIWEAAMSSARFGLDNVTAIVDRNGFQLSGPTEDVKPLEPLAEKWRAFGWAVLEIDGGSPEEILWALNACEAVQGKPTVILARTAKGRRSASSGIVSGVQGRNDDGLLLAGEESS